MKRTILIIATVGMLVAAFSAFLYVRNGNSLDDLMESNIEALAQYEGDYRGRWRTVGCGGYRFDQWKTYCCPDAYYDNCPGRGDCYSTVIYGCD